MLKQKFKRVFLALDTNKLNDAIKLINLLKEYDLNININWKLAHYKSVIKYLKNSDKAIAATGGTNWKKFLPPKFQKIIFFPKLWSKKEKENWGKGWVKSIVTYNK